MDDLERIQQSLRAMPPIHITMWETQLIFNGDRPAASLPSASGKLPIAPEMPTRRRISIEEFEADMRAARAQPEKR